MTPELFALSLLNGISYGLMLFMLSAGLTVVFSLMGVLNFAHASFYLLGAYVAQALAHGLGFWGALLVAPLAVGLLGGVFERTCLRPLHRHGPLPGLLVTFGLSYVVLEAVQLVWGRSTIAFALPTALQGALFSWHGMQFPRARGFAMAVAAAAFAVVWLAVSRSRTGLVLQAALEHPQMAQALGHDVPRVFTLVFAGGAALAALAGVLGGATYVTEPGMAASVGSIVFVIVVVGGMGSLGGAFAASLLIGVVQTLAVALDHSLAELLRGGGPATALATGGPLWTIKLSQLAPVLPYLLLVGMLLWRPQGLLGRRGV